MDINSFEVFCKNLECGDVEENPGTFATRQVRRHRRMNYMGTFEIGFWKMVSLRTIEKLATNDETPSELPPIGTYHRFICPVCGSERVFWEKEGYGIQEATHW